MVIDLFVFIVCSYKVAKLSTPLLLVYESMWSNLKANPGYGLEYFSPFSIVSRCLEVEMVVDFPPIGIWLSTDPDYFRCFLT